MDKFPTDINSILIQYINIRDTFNLSRMSKNFYQRIWLSENVWYARKLSLHKERNLNVPKHLLYCWDKKLFEILKHAAKYGHDVLFLQLFRLLLNIVKVEGIRILADNPDIHFEFDQIHKEMCCTLNLAYYYILIGPYMDILLTLLEETIDFIPFVTTEILHRKATSYYTYISYTTVIYKGEDSRYSEAVRRARGASVFLAIYHKKYDTVRIFLEKGPLKLPYYFADICDKLLCHPDLCLKLLKYDHPDYFLSNLLQGCHKLARIDILDTLINEAGHFKSLIIYRTILKRLIREEEYDYIMHFMKICHEKTIKDIGELADKELKQKIQKDKKLMKINTIRALFSIKPEDDSELENLCQGKTKNGKKCTRKVARGRYCWQHDK